MAGVGMVVLFLPGMLFIYATADAPGVLRSICDVDEDCELNLSCIKTNDCPVGTCRRDCHKSYTWSSDLKKCVKEVDIGGACEHYSECQTSGAICSGGICKCDTNSRAVYTDGYCASEDDKLLGDQCSAVSTSRDNCLHKMYSYDGEFLRIASNSRTTTCKDGKCACPDGLRTEEDGCSYRMLGEECKYYHDCSQGGCVSGNCECLLGQKQVDNRCVNLDSIGNQGHGEACASNGITLDRLCQEDLFCVRCLVVGDICINGAAILSSTAVWWSIWWTIGILYISM